MRICQMCLVGSVIAIWTGFTPADEPLAETSDSTATILSNLRNDAGFLASDALRGREAGSQGSRVAAVYLIDRLEEIGAQPGGDDGSFFQEFRRGYRNILAEIPGSDPSLSSEVVLLGAHYDHVGTGSRQNSYGPIGQIHNGADDNASGVAVLLSVCRALAKQTPRPRRTILCAFWDAEEKGLWGSQHWVDHPSVPLPKISLSINLDMVGRLRDRRVELYGVRTAAGLQSLAAGANHASQLRLEYNWRIRQDSDHYSLFRRRIPFLMPFTGMHPDYHRPTDDLDKLNYAGMHSMVQFIVSVVETAADRDTPFAFRGKSSSESNRVRDSWIQPARNRPRLGIQWHLDEEGRSVIVSRVAPGRPAARAGIRRGDRILRFGGHRFPSNWDFRALVQAAETPAQVILQRGLEAEPRTVQVQLEGEPFRIGLSWRYDEAEPESVLVTAVEPGSPADSAGLKPGDRVLAVNDERPESEPGLQSRLAAERPAHQIRIERYGRVLDLVLHPVPKAAVD